MAFHKRHTLLLIAAAVVLAATAMGLSDFATVHAERENLVSDPNALQQYVEIRTADVLSDSAASNSSDFSSFVRELCTNLDNYTAEELEAEKEKLCCAVTGQLSTVFICGDGIVGLQPGVLSCSAIVNGTSYTCCGRLYPNNQPVYIGESCDDTNSALPVAAVTKFALLLATFLAVLIAL